MKLKIGNTPKYMHAVERRFLMAAQAIWGEINSDTAEAFVFGIGELLLKAPPIDSSPGKSEEARSAYLSILSYAYGRCLEVSFGWKRKWVVNSLSNFSNAGGTGAVISPNENYCISPIVLVLNDFKEGAKSCVSYYLKIKNGDLPEPVPGELVYLKESLRLDENTQADSQKAPISLSPESTPPIALAMIEMILGKNSGPKFRKFPENRQAELLKAAQAALTILNLPTDSGLLNPEEVVQAIDREVQKFLLLGEPVIPDILLAALSALFGFCLVWAYGAEWKLAPKDEGDMLYVIGKGEDGWAQPSDLVRTALQGAKRSSLSSSFKSFHRP
jgi:hypothetical protein